MQDIETQWFPPPNENDDDDTVYDEPAEVLQLMLFPAIACIVLYSAGMFYYLLRRDTIDEHARRDDIVTDTHDFNYLLHRVLEHGKSDILTLSNADLIHQMAGEMRDLKKLQLDTLLMLDPRQGRLDVRSLHKKYEKCEGRHLDHDGRFGPKGLGWNIHKPGKPYYGDPIKDTYPESRRCKAEVDPFTGLEIEDPNEEEAPSSFRTPENDALAAEYARQNLAEERAYLQRTGAARGEVILEAAGVSTAGQPKTVVPVPVPLRRALISAPTGPETPDKADA